MKRAQLVSLVFRLTSDRLDRLKQLSADTRIRQSEFLREAIADLLKKYEGTRPGRASRDALIDRRLAEEKATRAAAHFESCACGREYSWAAFLELPAPETGSLQESVDKSGAPIFLELRQCVCRSTMARIPPVTP